MHKRLLLLILKIPRYMQHLLLVALTATLVSAGMRATNDEKNSGEPLTVNIKATPKFQDSIAIVGNRVFITQCANCHRDTMNALAPSPVTLSTMTACAVLASLENGKMRLEGAKLSDAERKAVAQWVTKNRLK